MFSHHSNTKYVPDAVDEMRQKGTNKESPLIRIRLFPLYLLT